MLDETEQNLGVLKLADAIKLAKDKGLDLIEVTASAVPPVCRIISHDKFRYQQEKREKKQKAQQKNVGMKQVQISVREAKGDLMNKIGRMVEFFADGHQVEIAMTLRGREKGNVEFAKGKMREFITLIPVPHQIVAPVSPGGRGLYAIVAKK